MDYLDFYHKILIMSYLKQKNPVYPEPSTIPLNTYFKDRKVNLIGRHFQPSTKRRQMITRTSHVTQRRRIHWSTASPVPFGWGNIPELAGCYEECDANVDSWRWVVVQTEI